VGRDPEVRHTQKGEKVVNFSLATDRWRKGAASETDWHEVVVFGQTGEFVANYVKKGSCVIVRGAIRYETWEDKHGQKRTSTKINAAMVELISGGRSKDEPADHPAPEKPFEAGDDDVPFAVMIAPLAAALLGVIA